jgi:hypothetical protein
MASMNVKCFFDITRQREQKPGSVTVGSSRHKAEIFEKRGLTAESHNFE